MSYRALLDSKLAVFKRGLHTIKEITRVTITNEPSHVFRVEEKKAIADSPVLFQNALKKPIWLFNTMKKVNVR